MLKGKHVDLVNTNEYVGILIGGLFIKEFIKVNKSNDNFHTNWLHFDIAGINNEDLCHPRIKLGIFNKFNRKRLNIFDEQFDD